MPQFDTAYFLPQLVWLAVIFTTLYFAVVRPTLPKVGRIIDERESRVAGDLDAAEAAKSEADAIRTRYDDGMAAAREAAQAQVGTARDDAGKAAELRLKELATVLDGKAAEAGVRLTTARAAAQSKLAATTADLTAEAVQRLVGIDVPMAEIKAALAAQK